MRLAWLSESLVAAVLAGGCAAAPTEPVRPEPERPVVYAASVNWQFVRLADVLPKYLAPPPTTRSATPR
jgi:hypothetical protein